MTKNELVWVFIRFSGLFFLYKALVIFPGLIGAFSFIKYVWPDIESTIGNEAMYKHGLSQLSQFSFTFLFYLGFSIYLLIRGKLIFKLVKIPSEE